MGKRKRSGNKAGSSSGPGNQPLTKRPRVDADAAGAAAAAAAVDDDYETLLQDRSLFVQDLSRADHDRELRLYRLLSSPDVEIRIRAADVIVSALFGGGGGEDEKDKKDGEGEEDEDEDEEGKGATATPQTVPEAVLLRHLERRLLRGLASGSEAARVGFSYVLSELLSQLFGGADAPRAAAYPGLTFDRVLDLLLAKTKPGSNLPGQEERDHYWGQLFGLQSFAESGVLFAGVESEGESESGPDGRWGRVLRCLLQLGRKKVWLRPQACFVVVQAIARGHVPDEAAVAATLQTIADDVGDGSKNSSSGSSIAATPEGLGIWLAARARFPAMALPPPWTAPLTAGSHKELVAVLKASSQDDEKPAVKQGNASSQLHFVWDLLLAEVIRRQPAKQFDSFWIAVVDQVYFAKGASDHQKLTGFKIFQKALAICADNGDVYPGLFSQNFMTCVMNQASNATPRLHRAAVQVLKAVEKQVEDRPVVLTQVLAALLGNAPRSHGVYDIDERVKGTGDGTKPVERILRFAEPDNVEDVIQILRTGALQAPDPKHDQKPLRILADYLFRLATRAGSSEARAAAGDEERESVGSVAFQALTAMAYPDKPSGQPTKTAKETAEAKAKAKALPALSEKTEAACRQYLLSAAGALLKRPDDFASFCRTVLSIDAGTAGIAMTDEVQSQVHDGRKQLKHLLRETDRSAAAARAYRAYQGLAVLLAVSLLQLYHEPRPDALEVLQDIQACSDKLAALAKREKREKKSKKKEKKNKKGKKEKEEEEEEEEKTSADAEPDMGEVLTDVLLAMLAESSQLTRQASLQVFEAFTPYMSVKALDNLTDVLAAEENTSGYRALFNLEGEEDEEDDEDGEDEDEDEDVDMDSVEEMSVDEKSGGEESASEDSDDESSDSGEEEEEEEGEEEEEEEEEEGDGEEETKTTTGKKANGNDVNDLEAALMKTFRVKQTLGQETAAAKKTGGATADDTDDDTDDSDSDESDMSDDAMLALDGHLAGHLRLIQERSEGRRKKERDEARAKVVAFKHRVLDLLEAYVRREAGGRGAGARQRHGLVLHLLLPLAVLVRDTKEAALGQKAMRIVQEAQKQLKRGRAAGGERGAGEEAEAEAVAVAEANADTDTDADTTTSEHIDAAMATLEALHEAANDRAESRAFSAAVSAASLAIASAVFAWDRTAYRRVADVYRQTQDHWVLDGWSVRASLFTDWYNWCQNVRTRAK